MLKLYLNCVYFINHRKYKKICEKDHGSMVLLTLGANCV